MRTIIRKCINRVCLQTLNGSLASESLDASRNLLSPIETLELDQVRGEAGNVWGSCMGD